MPTRPLRLAATLLAAAFLLHHPAHAQGLGGTLDEVREVYAVPYVQPLVDALGADMNAGLFHTARVGGGLLPLVDVYAGVKVMGALVSGGDKAFDLTYETERSIRARDGNRYRVPVTFQLTDAPTVFGDTSPGTATARVNETVDPGPDGTTGTGDDVVIDTTVTFGVLPGLLDTPIAPFAVPHFGIGSLFGTSIVVRYLPEIGYGDVGSVGFRGFGIRHSFSQYVPLLPVSVSAQVMWQKLTISDDDDEVFSASALAANVAVSKSLVLLTVYGGLQVERSSVDVRYTFRPEDADLAGEEIAFDLTGDGRFRLIGGTTFTLGLLHVNVDASVGSRTVVSAGAGLSL